MADNQSFNITGIEGVLDSLKALPKEVTQKRGGPVRKVLRKAAHMIRDEAKKNLQRVIDRPNDEGRDESTGATVKNIKTLKGKYQGKGERYVVTVPKRARHPSGVSLQLNAQRLEYGTSKREPMPFMRPAFHSKKAEVINYVARELPKEIDKIVRKLARQNAR